MCGGDDAARTRDLCRDSPAFWRNLLKLGAADGFFQRPKTPMVTVIGPLLDPRPLPSKPLPKKPFFPFHNRLISTVFIRSFRNYSFGNILEIARQKPDATRVAGLYAWNQLGRKVKKGERGIRIFAPVIGIRRKKDEEAEKDIRTQNQAVLVGFRAAYVFDVSQTEGKELPEFSERVSGDAREYRDRLVDFVIGQGIELEFKESIASALGMSYGGKIALLPGQSSAEEFSTLVHELAHEMLHKAERRTATTKTVRETEAEAIAFVVGKATCPLR
jgi:hypothetical protein